MINYRAPAFACVGLMVGFMGKLIASALQAKEEKTLPARAIDVFILLPQLRCSCRESLNGLAAK